MFKSCVYISAYVENTTTAYKPMYLPNAAYYALEILYMYTKLWYDGVCSFSSNSRSKNNESSDIQ